MNEGAIPAVDPLVLEEESAIVSETDAALHSSDDEVVVGGNVNTNWLSSTHTINHNHAATQAAAQGHDDDSENDSVDENELKESAGPEDFYCSNLDDEDEAYVYKHLRSGREETVHIRRKYQQQNAEQQGEDGSSTNSNNLESSNLKEEEQPSATTQMNNSQSIDPLQQVRLLKPRTSDAILSCPRCFNVVCMDCQQHERYSNQYRAMFVMNIGVDWSRKMMYDDAIGGLKTYSNTATNRDRHLGGTIEEGDDEEEDVSMPDRIPHDDNFPSSSNTTDSTKEAYYSVHCSYCRLELAALNMDDEIYYFFGCIASS